jgi:CHAT domain-containing protein
VFDHEEQDASGETEMRREALLRAAGLGSLRRLEGTGREATAVCEAVGGFQQDLYLRMRANEENVYRAPLREARYLLFATHGFLGGDFAGVAEPSLVLTLVGNPPGVDGFLGMGEVLSLDLNADLVVLSACSTSGREDRVGNGEGFAGLTRSFMYAGGRNLVVTHWSVDSAAAEAVMTYLFRELGESGNTVPHPAAALRSAKTMLFSDQRQLETGASLSLVYPFFWGPFVLVGGGD